MNNNLNNRNLLIVIFILSLFTGTYSAYKLYQKINLHLYGNSSEIRPEPINLSQYAKKQEKEVVPQPKSEEEKVKLPEENQETSKQENTQSKENSSKHEKQEPVKAIKTIFEYKNSKAKKVFLTGSFLKWKEIPMKNKNGIWTAEVYILPGNYFYHFVVDGKKILDPKNPKAPTMGESIVMVKEKN